MIPLAASMLMNRRTLLGLAALFSLSIVFTLKLESLIVPDTALQGGAAPASATAAADIAHLLHQSFFHSSFNDNDNDNNAVSASSDAGADNDNKKKRLQQRRTEDGLRKNPQPNTNNGSGDISTTDAAANPSPSQQHNGGVTTSSSSSYQNPIPDDLTKDQLSKLPVPVRIMELYKQQHGHDALLRDYSSSSSKTNLDQRRYAVGFYVCPLSAGNRLHEFFNYMLWAVVTNRTLLWKYYDGPTCDEYASKLHQDPIHCQVANRLEDCAAILERAPWIPSFDEWAPKLGLLQGKNNKKDGESENDSNTNKDDDDDVREDEKDGVDVTLIPRSLNNPTFNPKNKKFAAGVDLKYEDDKLVLFPHRTNVLENILGDAEVRNKKLAKKWGRSIAEQLFSLGTNFLYGMLHRYSFDFTSQIRERAIPSSFLSQDRRRTLELQNSFTVALHSRHNDSRIDGCDITQEKRCLEKVLANQHNATSTGDSTTEKKQCRVAVMADRVCTISTLKEYLKTKDCLVEVAAHEAGNGTYAEHGPFAGSGYFQDLALGATVARDAIVGSELHGGMWRSSSLLLMELVDFQKRMETHFDSENDDAKAVDDVTVDHCMLPKNNLVCHGWGIC